MSTTPPLRVPRLLAALLRSARVCTLLAVAPLPGLAQAPQSAQAPAGTASNAAQPARHGGTALDGQPFALRPGDGRVRVLMFWRTDCAVCLNKMPELRANAQGWKSQPFDLVLINTDSRRDDALAYDRLRRDLNAGRGPLISTWQGDVQLPPAWQARGRLPLMLVIDGQGGVRSRHEGRVPPELWDQVADLLP